MRNYYRVNFAVSPGFVSTSLGSPFDRGSGCTMPLEGTIGAIVFTREGRPRGGDITN